MARGAIRVVSINGPLTVTFTAASGATPAVFSDEACTTTIALPATVADGAATTFYFASPGAYTLSVKTASGIQIAGDLNSTKVVSVYAGDVGVYSYDARLVAKDFSGDSGRHSPATDLAATYGPARVPKLVNPHGLRRWRKALGDARTVPAVATVYGTSITQGNNADNSVGGAASAVQANYRNRSYTAQLRALINARLGTTDPGEGAILLDTANDARLTATSLIASGTIAPHQKGFQFDASTDSMAIAVTGYAEVRLCCWNPNSGGGALRYQWDAGTITTLGTGAVDTFTTTTIATPDTGAHTLTILGPAAGNGYLSRVDGFAVASAARTGVVVNRLGFPGQTAHSASGTDFFSGTNRDRIMRATFNETGTNLAVLEFGANDYWYQVGGHTTSANTTPTTFHDDLAYMVEAITNQGGRTLMTTPASVLIVAGPRRPAWDIAGPTYTEQQFYDQALIVANAYDHCAFLDLSEAWGDNTSVGNAGLANVGDVHPLRAGHGDFARILLDAITAPEITAA